MKFIYVDNEKDIPAAIAAHGLDRRFNYSLFVDTLVTTCWVTEACTGCSEHGEYESAPAIGCGCHECGYTGKRRNCYPNAVEAKLGVIPFTKRSDKLREEKQ